MVGPVGFLGGDTGKAKTGSWFQGPHKERAGQARPGPAHGKGLKACSVGWGLAPSLSRDAEFLGRAPGVVP